MMQDIILFEMAWGLQPPWFVDSYKFDAEENGLELYRLRKKWLKITLKQTMVKFLFSLRI